MVLLAARCTSRAASRKTLRRGRYEVRLDTAFDARGRAPAPRRRARSGRHLDQAGDDGRPIRALHRAAIAHSAEAWEQGGELVGGLYGVSLGGAFFGESMFAARPDASKVAFATLVGELVRWDFDLVDCQVHTPHLERFGASDWPRPRFLERCRDARAPHAPRALAARRQR